MMTAAHRFSSVPKSPIAGVSAPAWKRYAAACEVQPSHAVSESGGLGLYDIRPRRLVELGYVTDLRTVRMPPRFDPVTGLQMDGRQVHACNFVLPWTQSRFLADALAQFAAFSRSNVLYHSDLMSGALQKPEGCSMAGALVVLHRGGRGALAKWPEMFDDTKALYDVAQGAF